MRLNRSSWRWIGVGLVAVVVTTVVVVVGGMNDDPLDSSESDGYLGLRLLLEQRGASVTALDGDDVTEVSTKDYSVVFVLRPGGVSRTQLASWHRYVAGGGRLVLGQPDIIESIPTDPLAPTEVASPGACTIPGADGLGEIHPGSAVAHHVHVDETSCFGTGASALVTSGTCQAGTQFILSDPGIFDNATMGAPTSTNPRPERRGNAALATFLLSASPNGHVGIVTDGVNHNFGSNNAAITEPICGDTNDPNSVWKSPILTPEQASPASTIPDSTVPDPITATNPGDGSGSGSGGSGSSNSSDGGSVADPGQGGSGNGEGSTNRSGQQSSLLDYLSPGLKLALAQLLAILVWYAWRRSCRDGVVVSDALAVQLRSSRAVEAVAALHRRSGDRNRIGHELRLRTRQDLARAAGLPADTPTTDLAASPTVRSRVDPEQLERLLDGPSPTTDRALMNLASALHNLRSTLGPTIPVRFADTPADTVANRTAGTAADMVAPP